MPTAKQIEQTLEIGRALKLVTHSYTEISSLRIRRIRDRIIRNRDFVEEISRLYLFAKALALHKGIYDEQKTDRTLSIVLTSNYKFYGDLNNQLIRFFVINTSKYATDRLIIGRTGIDFLKSINYFHPYQVNILKKDVPNDLELKNLVAQISGYKRILVYFSQFKSILTQLPLVKDITQYPTKISSKNPINYIFEPEIGNIMRFFDTQITTVLLEQAFLESELARAAARLITSNRAENNADVFIADKSRDLLNSQRSITNRRILEVFTTTFNLRGLYHAK